MAKTIIAFNLAGGMDAFNAISYRNAASITAIQTARQSAPANILDYTVAPSKMVALAAGSPSFTVTDTAGVAVGRLCYGDGIDRVRKLTVSTVVDNGDGTFTITLSGNSYKTNSATKVYFATTTQLFDLNEATPLTVNGTQVNPAFNQNLRWLADAFNVADTPENMGRTKAAVISLVGPMLRKYIKLNSASGIYNMRTYNLDNSIRNLTNNEMPKNLTSHNDQQSTWVTNAPEGAIKGWGGGIADTFYESITSNMMKQLSSITLEAGNAYTAGTSATSYAISNRAILLEYPGYATTAWPTGKENAATASALTDIIRQAAKTDPASYDNDYHVSVVPLNQKAEEFQNVLKVVPAITSIPSTTTAAARGFLENIRQILKLMLMNNPNRNFVLTRSVTTVTAETQVTTCTANRASGSNIVTLYAPGHGFFTSNTDSTDLTDSVVITGIDASTPAAGYKITLVPGNEDNYFTVTTTATTQLSDVQVTARLKHNLTIGNKVFVASPSTSIDSSAPSEGYVVGSVPNAYTVTFETTAAGSLPGGTTAFVKLVNLEKQVFYTNTPGFSWDTHNSANTPELGYLDEGLAYMDSVGRRMLNAEYVGFTISDFGRTFTTNATGGTDHGWGNYTFVFGKQVRGNKVYGDAIDYNLDGPHIGGNMLIPTTSVYQYGATVAKWMGASDAQVQGLFPKLVNWNTNEWYLPFLNPTT